MEVHYHFVREKVLRGEIEPQQVNTEDQVADIFTKGLGGPKFETFRKQLTRLSLRERVVVEWECKNSPTLSLLASRWRFRGQYFTTTEATYEQNFHRPITPL